MICPIMPVRKEDMIGNVCTECVKSGCAWFDNEQGQCAVLSININLMKGNENGH